MRSGREHLVWILAVEVRQGTLGVDGRGWGPAGNTGRGWSWLRSGREHCGSRVAVGRGRRGRRGRQGWQGGRGGRGGEEEEDEAGVRRRQEEATDIKSNNPHLAGGEKSDGLLIIFVRMERPFLWCEYPCLIQVPNQSGTQPVDFSTSSQPSCYYTPRYKLDHLPQNLEHLLNSPALAMGASRIFFRVRVRTQKTVKEAG